jgi:hypothetical protein
MRQTRRCAWTGATPIPIVRRMLGIEVLQCVRCLATMRAIAVTPTPSKTSPVRRRIGTASILRP